MCGKHQVDDVEIVKDHYNGTGTTGRGTQTQFGWAPATAIVRTGHPALDAALAVDRTSKPDLAALGAACRRGMDAAPLAQPEGPSRSAGRLADMMSLTHDRDGAGTTLHVGTTHMLMDARGRSRTIRVWHELGTQNAN